MAELATMTVRLRYSPSRALANINALDFDPALHQRMDEGEQEENHEERQSNEPSTGTGDEERGPQSKGEPPAGGDGQAESPHALGSKNVRVDERVLATPHPRGRRH